jgi:cell division protein FtsQ
MANPGDQPVNRYTQFNYQGNRGFASGILVVIALFLLATGGAAWVSMGIVANDRWPIRWLELNGEFQRVSAEQLRASVSPLINESFFTIDLQELRGAASRISWVSAVYVQKKWPDTVTVTIEEFTPVAHWNRGQLISKKGEAFSVPESDEIQGLPWLQGPQDRLDEVLHTWSEFSELLVPLGLVVHGLSLDQRGAWSMDLNNGTHVQLGRESALERLQRLLASWDSLMLERPAPPQDVDLRYTNGFAVMWPQHLKTAKGTDS